MISLTIPTKANLWWWSTHHRQVLNMSSSTAVVILCGAISRRLGVSNALMQVNGKPLFMVVEENLSPLGLPVYLVSKVPLSQGEFL